MEVIIACQREDVGCDLIAKIRSDESELSIAWGSEILRELSPDTIGIPVSTKDTNKGIIAYGLSEHQQLMPK
jgi:hypothetical protein